MTYAELFVIEDWKQSKCLSLGECLLKTLAHMLFLHKGNHKTVQKSEETLNVLTWKGLQNLESSEKSCVFGTLPFV